MATNAGSGAARGAERSARTAERPHSKGLGNAISADTIFDLVARLGLVDMVVERLRGRIQESDIDDVLDDLGAYIRRTPEAVVVGLGAATLAAGVLVFLNNRSQHAGHGPSLRDDREEPIQSESERTRSAGREVRDPGARPRASVSNTARKRSS